MSVPEPTDPNNPELWKLQALRDGIDLEIYVVYYRNLWEREKMLRVRFQQLSAALGFLSKNSAMSVLHTCVECNGNAIVDGRITARLLACGHIMHSLCMNSYCAQKDGSAPTCPVEHCGVPFQPDQLSSKDVHEEQTRQCPILIAMQFLSAETPEKGLLAARQTLHDNLDAKHIGGIAERHPMLQELYTKIVNTSVPAGTITELCTTIIQQEKERLTRMATDIALQLAPSTQGPFMFPPPPQKQKRDASKAVDRKRTVMDEPVAASGGGAAAASAAKRPKVVAAVLPPGMQPDVLLPEGTEFEKCRMNNKTCIVTKYDGKCQKCRRPLKAQQSVIVGVVDGKGFECSLCGLKMTSYAVNEARLAGQDCAVACAEREEGEDPDNPYGIII